MKRKSGFTLIEILVVMAILAILSALILPRLTEKAKQAKRLKAVLQIKAFQSALEEFNIGHDRYPTTEEGLEALVKEKGVGGKSYLDGESLPLDPWKEPYLYLSPGLQDRPYDIASYGQDKCRGGTLWDQDIESWNIDKES